MYSLRKEHKKSTKRAQQEHKKSTKRAHKAHKKSKRPHKSETQEETLQRKVTPVIRLLEEVNICNSGGQKVRLGNNGTGIQVQKMQMMQILIVGILKRLPLLLGHIGW